MPNSNGYSKFTLLDDSGIVAALNYGQLTHWRLAAIPDEDELTRLTELSGNSRNAERLDLINLGKFVLREELQEQDASDAVGAVSEDEHHARCEWAFLRALHSASESDSQSYAIAPDICRDETQASLAAVFTKSIAGSDASAPSAFDSADLGPSARLSFDWPQSFSGILAAAALGDAKALRVLLDSYQLVDAGDKDTPMTSRYLSRLEKELGDVDSRFVANSPSDAPLGGDAANVRSADPIDHLTEAVRLLNFPDAAAQTGAAVFELLIAERLLSVAGWEKQAALVAARRSALALGLPAEIAKDIAQSRRRMAREWRFLFRAAADRVVRRSGSSFERSAECR